MCKNELEERVERTAAAAAAAAAVTKKRGYDDDDSRGPARDPFCSCRVLAAVLVVVVYTVNCYYYYLTAGCSCTCVRAPDIATSPEKLCAQTGLRDKNFLAHC